MAQGELAVRVLIARRLPTQGTPTTVRFTDHCNNTRTIPITSAMLCAVAQFAQFLADVCVWWFQRNLAMLLTFLSRS